MPSIIDILFLILLLIMAIRGCIKGFFTSLLSGARFFIAVALTMALTNPVAGLLNDHLINPPIYAGINGQLTAIADQVEGGATEFAESIPDSLKGYLSETQADPTAELDAMVEEYSTSISQTISGAISSLLATILIFVLSMLLLSLIIKIVGGLIKASPIGVLDRVLGFVLGLLVGVAIVVLSAQVVGPVLTAAGQQELVEGSVILGWLNP